MASYRAFLHNNLFSSITNSTHTSNIHFPIESATEVVPAGAALILQTFYSVAIVIILYFNAKALPFSWSISLLWHILPQLQGRPWSSTAQNGDLEPVQKRNPLFEPLSILQRSSLGEMDYNLHKSNSTFFSDADVSRAKLVFKLIGPALCRKDEYNINQTLQKEGHRGTFKIVLGAVHASYRKEIKPFAVYENESRVQGWDKKWLVIETNFWRKSKKGSRELLATVVGKFVMKKGRFTVEPARVFKAAGLLHEDTSEPDPSAESHHHVAPVDLDSQSWDINQIERRRSEGLDLTANWLEFSSKIMSSTKL